MQLNKLTYMQRNPDAAQAQSRYGDMTQHIAYDMTPEDEATIIEGFRAGMTESGVAALVGIDKTTLMRWLNNITGLEAKCRKAFAVRQMHKLNTLAEEDPEKWLRRTDRKKEYIDNDTLARIESAERIADKRNAAEKEMQHNTEVFRRQVEAEGLGRGAPPPVESEESGS